MAYLGNNPGVASIRMVDTITPTAGQTDFISTSGYALGYIDVFQNGVKLIVGVDFTASDGLEVVLTVGAAVGDIVELVAYVPTSGFVDAYTKSEADTLIAAKEAADATILKNADIGVTVLAPTGDGSGLTNLPAAGFTSPTFLDQGTLFSRDSANTLSIPDLGGVVDGTLVEVAATTKALNTSGNWDASTYATASNRAGKDFYVYLLKAGGVILSNNSTVPTGYTSSNSRKIAGFHCLSVAVGTISGHSLTGYAQGDILPRSVWDRFNRPVSAPEGMVLANSGLWVDIYLASLSGGNLASIYNGTIIDGASNPDYHWYNFVERLAEVGKKLPFQVDFMSAANGSNNETNISGSSDPGTTGGHIDTAGRRMISDIGCEDMAGVLYQYGQDTAADDFTGDGTTYDGVNSIGKGKGYEAPDRVRLGGDWINGPVCGVRSSRFLSAPLALESTVSARGFAEPAANRL
jgi:hypothetical protein